MKNLDEKWEELQKEDYAEKEKVLDKLERKVDSKEVEDIVKPVDEDAQNEIDQLNKEIVSMKVNVSM